MKVKEVIQMLLDGHINLDDELVIYVYDNRDFYERAELVATGKELDDQLDLFAEVVREKK